MSVQRSDLQAAFVESRFGEPVSWEVQVWGFVVGCMVAVVLCAIFVGVVVGDRGGEPVEILDKINPNSAPVASLVRLPGIGLSKAQAIVAYRRQKLAQGGLRDGRVFRSVSDLQQVKSIGAKTVERIAEFVDFESR